MLELYHFESCPYCQKVRNKLEALDLSYISHPSPQGSKNRDKAQKYIQDLQFPILVDDEKKLAMIESEDICQYLEKTYGSK